MPSRAVSSVRKARAYNQKAEKAEKLYEKLPTRFLLSQPDMYEGI